MKDFRDRSKERLEDELGKLFHDLMVSCLDRAEKILRPDKNSNYWSQFRFGILNLGNDKIRQFKEKLMDYSIEFRPPMFSVEYNVDVPIENVVEITFNASASKDVFFKLKTNIKAVADLLKESISCGTVIKVDTLKRWEFTVDGLYDNFHKVIPFFDNNTAFKGATLEKYKVWKEQVYLLEKGDA